MPLHIDFSVAHTIRKASDIPPLFPPTTVGVWQGRKGKYMTKPSYLYGSLL